MQGDSRADVRRRLNSLDVHLVCVQPILVVLSRERAEQFMRGCSQWS